MCEKCRRNTEIKRAALAALFSPNASVDVDAIPGYRPLLELGRQLERCCAAPPIDGKADPEEVVLYGNRMRALSWQERTDVLRLAAWLTEHAAALQQHIAGVKEQLNDPDLMRIDVRIVDGAIEVTKNGDVVQRIPFGEEAGRSESEALDAAELAMQAHREQAQHPQHPGDG